MNNLLNKKININGNDLHYFEKGKGATFIFLHGFFAGPKFFEESLNELSKKFRVIAPQIFGYELINQPLNLEEYAEHTNDFLNKIGAQNSILSGYSVGGGISTILLNQEDYATAILINPICKTNASPIQYMGQAIKIGINDLFELNGLKTSNVIGKRNAIAFPQAFATRPKQIIRELKEISNFDENNYPTKKPLGLIHSQNDEYYNKFEYNFLKMYFPNLQRQTLTKEKDGVQGHYWGVAKQELLTKQIIQYLSPKNK